MSKTEALQLFSNILDGTEETYDSWTTILFALMPLYDDNSPEVKELFRRLTTFTGNIKLKSHNDGPHRCPAHQMLRELAQQYLNKPSKIIDFYTGGTDSENRTLQEILSWNNFQLESSHTAIQWLLPLNTPSNFNHDAPILTPEDIQEFTKPLLQQNLTLATTRFLKFLGLNEDCTKNEFFNTRIPTVWHHFNHNFLRITRALTSLKLLHQPEKAAQLYQTLLSLSQEFNISPRTRQFWHEAFTTQQPTSIINQDHSTTQGESS